MIDPPAAGVISLMDALRPVDDRRRWENPGPGTNFIRSSMLSRDHRSAQGRPRSLLQIMRRNIGRHAHRDTGRTIDQQIRNPGRQDLRLHF